MPRTFGYADPVGAGLKAFTGLSDFFDRQDLRKEEIEDRKQRREMTAIQTADARLSHEQNKKKAALMDQVRNELPGLGEDLIGDEGFSKNLDSALKKDPSSGAKYTDEEGQAMLRATSHMPHIDLNKLDETGDTNNSFLKILDHIEPQIMDPKAPQKIVIKKDQYPELFSTFEKLHADEINQGTDKHGQKSNKSVVAALIDKSNPKMPTVSFVLNVDTPVKDGQVFQHIGDKDFSKFTVDPDNENMIKGNIDLNKRPVVRNKDGSISTVLSTSFEEDGKEVLIPRISQSGKVMSIDEAIKEYHKTGQYLGMFKTPEEADAYAQKLHSDHMWDDDMKEYSAIGQEKTSYQAPMTHGHTGDPNEDVVRLPIPVLYAHAKAKQQQISRINYYLAQLDPVSRLKAIKQTDENRKWNEAVKSVRKGVDSTKPPGEQMRQFIDDFSEKHPDMDPKKVLDYAKGLYEKTGDMNPYQKRTLDLKEADEARKVEEGKTRETDRQAENARKAAKDKEESDYKKKDLEIKGKRLDIEASKVGETNKEKKEKVEEKKTDKGVKTEKEFEKRIARMYGDHKRDEITSLDEDERKHASWVMQVAKAWKKDHPKASDQEAADGAYRAVDKRLKEDIKKEKK